MESIDDAVLDKLLKGHTRADFVRAVTLCRDAGVLLMPTFVPFTPWTTLTGYVELLDLLDELDLVEQVAPIQLAIRLLVTSGSPLLELPDIRAAIGEFEPAEAGPHARFDPASLTWPWRHDDPRVDALQQDIMVIAGAAGLSRSDAFFAIAALARERGGLPASVRALRARPLAPSLSEPWYCCAEPNPEQMAAI